MRRLVLGVAILALAATTLTWAVAGDQDIAREITERLRKEQEAGNLRGFNVNLKVAEGNVTLDGQVANKAQKALVSETARSVDGVKQVTSELKLVPGPTTSAKPAASSFSDLAELEPVITDEEITTQIAKSLSGHKQAGHLKGFRVEVAVKDGVVSMKGTVASPQQRELALQAVSDADGVRDTNIQLAIRPSQVPAEISAPTSADQDIADQIASSLRREQAAGNLAGYDIDLSVKDGVVTMEGHVADAQQMKLALDTARQTTDVHDVINRMVVSVVARTSEETVRNAVFQDNQEVATDEELDAKDREIGERLTKALKQAKQEGNLRGFGIGVHVDRGYAWLRGEVSDHEQQQTALDIASRVPGVRQVINDLKIAAPPVVVADDESRLLIAQEIAKRFEAASQLGSLRGADVDVKVDGEEILLTGAVASAEQAQLAVDLARQVPGVNKVLSGIAVEPGRAAYMALPASYTNAGGGAAPYMQAQLQPPMAIGPQGGSAASPYMLASRNGTYYPAASGSGAMDQTPRPLGATRLASYAGAAVVAPLAAMGQMSGMAPAHLPGAGHASVPARYDHPSLPGYSWPSYAAHPNYAAVTYPKQYSPSAWPYIGPFYPYPQVPLGWRKVSLKWDDGWWQLNFSAK